MIYDLPPKVWMPSRPAIIRPAEPALVKANFLPGWFPVMGAAAGFALSAHASAISTGVTITFPSTVVAGDLIVLLDVGMGGPPSTVTPSGFTIIANTASVEVRMISSNKIADGTEASTSLTGLNGSVSNQKAMYVFRGNSIISSLLVKSLNQQQTTGNPTSQNVTASGGIVPLVVFGCYATRDDGSFVSPRTMSPAKDGEINASSFAYLAYKIYNATPADVSVDMDDEGPENHLQSFYIECS